jgi:hypothetical protein
MKTDQKSAPDDDKNGDDHSNKRICEMEQNVTVPALMLWWLRVCVMLGFCNHVNTVDSSAVIRSISRLAANETTTIDDISDEQASEHRINVVEIVDRTIDEDEDKRHNLNQT